jgi:hypothetical protein
MRQTMVIIPMIALLKNTGFDRSGAILINMQSFASLAAEAPPLLDDRSSQTAALNWLNRPSHD